MWAAELGLYSLVTHQNPRPRGLPVGEAHCPLHRGPQGQEPCPRAAGQGGCGHPTPCLDSASPQNSALVAEGVEPIIAGLGALRGDGQQVGGAAASLDATCKATRVGPQGQWGSRSGLPRALPSGQGQEVTLPRGPRRSRNQRSSSRPNRNPWDWAAGERVGLGVWGVLTAVLRVMASEGEGEGRGGWAGAQDGGRVHGTGDHSRGRDVLGLEVNAGAGGLICAREGREV